RRTALRRGVARRRARARGEGRPRARLLPDGLLPARRDDARRRRRGVALPLSAAVRAPRPAARRRRHRADRLARRSALGDARDHPPRGLEELRLQHDRLRRRAAGHPGARLRGCASRRRRRVAGLPARDASVARADVRLRRDHHDDRLLPALRRAVRHDAGRPGERDAERRAPHVRGGVPLVEHGLRRGHRFRAVRHHPRPLVVATRRAEGQGEWGRMRRRARRILGTVALHAGLGGAAIVTALPLLWMVSASLMPAGEASAVPPRFLPSVPTLAHYRTLFARLDLGRNFANSVLVAAVVTGVALVLNSMAGYGFAKFRFAGRERLFRGLMAALVIPGQVAMLPLFLLLKRLGLVDTYAAVVIPGVASIFGILLVRQYMTSLPDSVLDAARIDGAGELRIYRSLVLRLSAPILVTLAIFTFMGTWNDFLWPLVVLA